MERARRVGKALVNRPNRLGEWNRGNRVHWGHTLLGLADLAAGDVAGAEQHLLAAGAAAAALGGSPQLNTFGPDFGLAAQLLDRDCRDAVVVYLNSCKRLWADHGSVLDGWLEAIHNGERPRLRRFADQP